MREIISRHEEERKKRRNQFIVGGILILIMAFSLLGYAFQGQTTDGNSSNSTIIYNGIAFVNQNGFWTANYGNQEISFTYHPSQISPADLANLTKNLDDFSGKPLHINSYDYNAESEIKTNLFPFASEIKNACLEGVNCSQSLQFPAKNCSNNFIIIQNGSGNVRQENNCIFISGQGEELIKLIDNILFKIFGIRE